MTKTMKTAPKIRKIKIMKLTKSNQNKKLTNFNQVNISNKSKYRPRQVLWIKMPLSQTQTRTIYSPMMFSIPTFPTLKSVGAKLVFVLAQVLKRWSQMISLSKMKRERETVMSVRSLLSPPHRKTMKLARTRSLRSWRRHRTIKHSQSKHQVLHQLYNVHPICQIKEICQAKNLP